MAAPDNTALLQSATRGFDHLFSNDITSAKAHFTGKDDPFHLLGLGVCAFLEAALGMETGLMTEATRLLTLSEAGARRQAKLRPAPSSGSGRGRQPRFAPGLEWEILGADAVVLLGLTNALGESYMGYLQCMYALNSAHSKFTKLYKTVYPHGLDAYATPAHSGSGTPTTSQPRASTSSRKDTITPRQSQEKAQEQDKTTLTVERTVRTSVSTSNLSTTSSLSITSSLSVTSTASAQTTKSHLPPPSGTPTRSFFGNPAPAPSLPLKHSISGTATGAGVGRIGAGGTLGGIEGAKTTGANTPTKGFFARWTSSAAASVTSLPQPSETTALVEELDRLVLADGERDDDEEGGGEDGPVEELILAGTAFGFGLFNLVFSLLPKKVQSLVGFFGFKHDRKLALRALAVAAAKKDVHGVFAGLVLMTYHGVVLLLAGYQADEAHILRQYRGIVDSVEERYPQGALWILNRAKILRMSHDASGAIRVLRDGLKPDRPYSFAQADTLLVFELAWTLLGEMRYQDAADMFLKITELNSWSHGTYYFLAAGCYSALGKHDKAQGLYDKIPGLIDQKKIGGKDLPTEVLIKKKLIFYKEKQKRRGGDPALYAQAIKISTAEELAIFWNTHARVHKVIAEEHILQWSALTPAPSFPSSKLASPKGKAPAAEPSGLPDLDTPDELALRSLLLGICHRTAGDFASSRECLRDAYARQPAVKVSTWIGGVAMFELAVLDLKIVEHKERNQQQGLAAAAMLVAEWERALAGAGEKLDLAIGLATNAVDLSSRLDSRIMMLRDEIAAKKEKLGIV